MAKLNSAMSRTKKGKSSSGKPSNGKSIKTSTGRQESSDASKYLSTRMDQYILMLLFIVLSSLITSSLLAIYPVL